MKFSEYLASFITPQMTLLEKFNALCKYLDENEISKFYIHSIRFTNGNTLSFIDGNPNKYTLSEINGNPNFFFNKLNVKVNGNLVVSHSYSSVFSLYYYYLK